jgi:hypothetical protein
MDEKINRLLKLIDQTNTADPISGCAFLLGILAGLNLADREDLIALFAAMELSQPSQQIH